MSTDRNMTALLSGLLRPLCLPYAAAVAVRNAYYDRFPHAVHRADVPVISVGNLTAGGTGKTPLVIELVRRLQTYGCRPAILTRGYKAAPGEVADEVLEFGGALPGVPVVVNPDRVAGAAQARTAHGADCLVLDDGFQHRRLARQLDIVLIDALRPWGDGLLPAGRAREPRRGLRRAHLFVITRCNQVPPAEVAAITLALAHFGNQPVLEAAVVPDALVTRDEERHPPASLQGRKLLAVCGIGNPRTFARLLADLGAPCPLIPFADHQPYGPRHLTTILAAAAEVGATEVVTTRKDWVKLAPQWPGDDPTLLRLDMRLVLGGALADFEARLRQAVESPL